MPLRTLVTWPDDRLRAHTQTIDTIDDSVRELFSDLLRTMYIERGLGIAAPQIGDARRMFLVDRSLTNLTTRWGVAAVCFINPEVLWVSDRHQDGEEGCLSFPQVVINVKRPLQARVRALGLDGQAFEMTGEGLLARCLLHEYDHMEGRLLLDQPSWFNSRA
jgi:peptide deformylase